MLQADQRVVPILKVTVGLTGLIHRVGLPMAGDRPLLAAVLKSHPLISIHRFLLERISTLLQLPLGDLLAQSIPLYELNLLDDGDRVRGDAHQGHHCLIKG